MRRWEITQVPMHLHPNTCVPDDVHESGRGREEAYLLPRLHVRYVCMVGALPVPYLYLMVGGSVAAYVYKTCTRSTTTVEEKRREDSRVGR